MTRASCFAFAGAFLSALLGSACATGDFHGLVSLETTGPITAADYEEVLHRWTRSERVYDKLDSKLFLHATFHSPEFRKAFLLRHQDIYGRGSEEAKRLALTAEGAEEQLEFFFSAFTADIKWNDFDSDKSIWRVTVEGDEGERVDGTVVKLKATANLRVIYPYITDFARVYAVRFPNTSDSGKPVVSSASHKMILRMGSALGQAALLWEFRPVPHESTLPLPSKDVLPPPAPVPSGPSAGADE